MLRLTEKPSTLRDPHLMTVSPASKRTSVRLEGYSSNTPPKSVEKMLLRPISKTPNGNGRPSKVEVVAPTSLSALEKLTSPGRALPKTPKRRNLRPAFTPN